MRLCKTLTLLVFSMVALAACDPAATADKLGRRTVETVVMPVVSRNLPAPQASAATLCIVQNASAAEVQALLRDVAVEAGSSTVRTIATIGARRETLACLARAGLPPLAL